MWHLCLFLHLHLRLLRLEMIITKGGRWEKKRRRAVRSLLGIRIEDDGSGGSSHLDASFGTNQGPGARRRLSKVIVKKQVSVFKGKTTHGLLYPLNERKKCDQSA
ncbi:hypothetical protein BYT27DRAFT_6741257 [Phlegmacium glaucopus]|nr:hypothetical protein BYT27DRAFT_6741257 [Phlegmacium glaucopus]